MDAPQFYVCYYFNLLTLKILVPLMHTTMLKLFLFGLFHYNLKKSQEIHSQ